MALRSDRGKRARALMEKNPAKKSFPRVYEGLTTLIKPDALVKGFFPEEFPIGITIHDTADRDFERIQRSLAERGLCYHLIVQRDGSITQHAWLTHQVWHAGKALWRGFSPNARFLAIAVVSWGELSKDGESYFSWTKHLVDLLDVREAKSNVTQIDAFWDAATEKQFESLKSLCLWAIHQGISPSNICGHDECAIPPGRKSDPGGVLPVSMSEFRKLLEEESLGPVA